MRQRSTQLKRWWPRCISFALSRLAWPIRHRLNIGHDCREFLHTSPLCCCGGCRFCRLVACSEFRDPLLVSSRSLCEFGAHAGNGMGAFFSRSTRDVIDPSARCIRPCDSVPARGLQRGRRGLRPVSRPHPAARRRAWRGHDRGAAGCRPQPKLAPQHGRAACPIPNGCGRGPDLRLAGRASLRPEPSRRLSP